MLTIQKKRELAQNIKAVLNKLPTTKINFANRAQRAVGLHVDAEAFLVSCLSSGGGLGILHGMDVAYKEAPPRSDIATIEGVQRRLTPAIVVTFERLVAGLLENPNPEGPESKALVSFLFLVFEPPIADEILNNIWFLINSKTFSTPTAKIVRDGHVCRLIYE